MQPTLTTSALISWRVEIRPDGVHRRLGPGAQAAGARADVDRRPHHAVAPQFGQPLFAEPPGLRVAS